MRELPLRVRKGDPVSLQRGRGGARGAKRLALAGQGRDAFLKRVDAKASALASEAPGCNGPQSRSTHLECLIGKRAQTLSPRNGHFPQGRKRVG